MLIRRCTASLVTVALVALGLIAVPATPVSAAGETAQLPTANPANFTPNVLDGEVDSIWQVGNTVIIGGTFTQIANATQNGGQVYNRYVARGVRRDHRRRQRELQPVQLDSDVSTVIPAATAASIYIAGDFNTVNGTNRRKVARLQPRRRVARRRRSTPTASTAWCATCASSAATCTSAGCSPPSAARRAHTSPA